MIVESKKVKDGAVIELHNKYTNRKLFVITSNTKEIKHHNRTLAVKEQWRGKIFDAMPLHDTCEPAKNQHQAVEEIKMWFKRSPFAIPHYKEIANIVGEHHFTQELLQ